VEKDILPEDSMTLPRNARVLFVDDDPEILSIIRTLCENVGISITTADSPEKALPHFAKGFDIVIVDGHLGTADGCDLITKFRNLPSGSKPYYILFTADKGKSKGPANEVIYKGGLPLDLMDAIARVYGSNRQVA
jgi:CheY-like chemotaxis protein